MLLRSLLFLIVVLFTVQSQAGLFAEEQDASKYRHDLVAQFASKTLLSLCGDMETGESQYALLDLPEWKAIDEELPPGVVIREQENFAGEQGLTARFKIGKRSCTLTLSPYRANDRAGDELAYGVSEAVAAVFGDRDNNWYPEQAMSGLHRIDPHGYIHQQTFFVQFQQKKGIPSKTWFAVFDQNPEKPKVILGRRQFNGEVIFGMSDGEWERRQNKLGEKIIAIQSKDPVDTQTGGFNTLAISKNQIGNFVIKSFMPIGDGKEVLRLRYSLGTDPLAGFEQLSVFTRQEDFLISKELPVKQVNIDKIRQGLMAKGLYPIYLELTPGQFDTLVQGEMFVLEIKRVGGSEIHLQVPAGQKLSKEAKEHLGFQPGSKQATSRQ